MIALPRPLTIDEIADLLCTAQHHAHADRGATRFHSGQDQHGQPFLIAVNTIDGNGFNIHPGRPTQLIAANEP